MGFSLLAAVRAVLVSVSILLGWCFEIVYSEPLTYQFKGGNFTRVSTVRDTEGQERVGAITTQDSVSGTITIDYALKVAEGKPSLGHFGSFPLVNLEGVPIEEYITDFSFSAGPLTLSSSNGNYIRVSKWVFDDTGNVIDWDMEIRSSENIIHNSIVILPNYESAEVSSGFGGNFRAGFGETFEGGSWIPPTLGDLSIRNSVNIALTQGAYETRKLVKGRKGIVELKVTSSLPYSGRLVFAAFLGTQANPFEQATRTSVPFNGTEQIITMPFTPNFVGPNKQLLIRLDEHQDHAESNEANNIIMLKGFEVIETKDLPISYVPVKPFVCKTDPTKCNDAKQKLSDFILKSNQFIQDTYPLKEDGVSSIVREEFSGRDNLSLRPFSTPCGTQISSVGWLLDLKVVNSLLKYSNAKRGVGVVPTNYFEYHKIQPLGKTLRGIQLVAYLRH